MERISPNHPHYLAGRKARDDGEPIISGRGLWWRKGWEDRNAELPYFIDVITATRNPDDPPVQTHRINYHSQNARAWLAKHSWWALHNGLTIHTAAVENDHA